MLTIYTNRYIPERFAALAIGPVVLVRPKYVDDKGLHEHERVHVKQFWRSPLLYGLRYKFSKAYRLQAEAEAYAEQAKYYADDRVPRFAEMLATLYGLGISVSEAEASIRKAQL